MIIQRNILNTSTKVTDIFVRNNFKLLDRKSDILIFCEKISLYDNVLKIPMHLISLESIIVTSDSVVQDDETCTYLVIMNKS